VRPYQLNCFALSLFGVALRLGRCNETEARIVLQNRRKLKRNRQTLEKTAGNDSLGEQPEKEI
jgi:hypothetical protein